MTIHPGITDISVSESLAIPEIGAGLYPGPLADRIREALSKTIPEGEFRTKEHIRAMHDAAKRDRLRAAQGWIQKAWAQRSRYFANGADLSPQDIAPKLVAVKTPEERDLFRLARFTWSLPYSRGYGRRLRFLVMDEHHDAVMGVLGLQSAPIDFAVRDRRIAYPKGEKAALVNQTMDIFTLGAVPPYNRLLAGKLIVYAAASQEIRKAYQDKYTGRVTELDARVIPSHLALLTTTSAFGRSSIYNRVSYRDSANGQRRDIAEPLGYTKGYGNVHLDALYPELKEFLIKQGIPANQGFGRGPKPVWQNITRTLTMLNVKQDGLKHGIRRQAWGIPLARNAWDYLSGRAEEPDYYETTFDRLAAWWRERWLLPRAQRVSDWRDWRRESLLQSITVEDGDDH